MQWIKPNINIDFMGKIRTAGIASTLAVAVCLAGIFFWPGPRFGVDFAGGAALEVRMKEGIDAPAIIRALAAQGYESPEVVSSADGSFLIRVRVDAPSDASRDALAQSIRGALQLAAPVAAPVKPVAAPVEPVAVPVEPVVAPVEPVAAPVDPVPPPAFRTPMQGLVGALLAPQLQGQTPDAGLEPVAPSAPESELPVGVAPEAVPVEPVEPAVADAGTGVEPATADVAAEPEVTVAAVEELPPVEPVVEPPVVPVEPPVEPVVPVAATPVAVRVDEVIVDTSGAKVDILVNRPFEPEELRDLLGSLEFEGRRMADMIGRLVPPAESVLETREADGSFRYDIPLAQVVNLNEQDVGAVKDIVRGAMAAEGLARPEELTAIDLTLSPIALRIHSTVPLDAARLAALLDRTRYRDINLFVRCRSAICPASIDERDQVYGYQINLRGFGPDVVESLNERLGAGAVVEELSMEWVGPKVGEKLRDDGIKSVLIALGLILVYVALRFDLRFAPGAVVCLFHDAMITLGFFVFTGMEVNLTTVAAILTIVGYSVNDTIVVYDRIRENLQKTQERDLVKVINTSVNETLSRTLLTSFTTILAVLAVAFFARGTIQDFAIAMIVGIVVGTYSSIYVAAPMAIVMDRKVFRRGQS